MTWHDFVYYRRGLLVSVPLLVALASRFHETEQDALIWPLGGFLVLSGFLLRVWTQQHLHYRLEVRKGLTTTGPYQYVRNPIYIGNTLMCASAVVCSELLWLVPATVVNCALVYSIAVRREEARLAARYGEPYRQYMAEVPRWVPRVRLGGILAPVNENLVASILAEIHCLLILLPFVLKEIL